MIKSFSDKETERLYLSGASNKFKDILKVAVRKLDYLNAATCLMELAAPPGNRLEALKGDKKGKYSIRINDRYRVVFMFQGRDAYEVEITDYH